MSRHPRSSLAEAFAPTASADSSGDSDRVTGLVGLLPPRPPHKAQPSLDQGEARSQDEAPVDVLPTASTDNEATDPERIRNVAFYLPPELLERLRRTAQSRQLTYADLLVEAATAHLDTVEAAFTAAQPVVPAGGMPSRTRRRIGTPGIQRQVRLDGHQIAWLDEQVARLQAPSRNALVVALLTAHLDSSATSYG